MWTCHGSRVPCCKVPSYGEVYAHLFARMCVSEEVANDRLCADLRHLARHTCLRSRRAILRHIDRAARTQHCMHKVSKKTLFLLRKKMRCDALESAMRLRSLQHKVLEHLWRPHGRLAHNECLECIRIATSATHDAEGVEDGSHNGNFVFLATGAQ